MRLITFIVIKEMNLFCCFRKRWKKKHKVQNSRIRRIYFFLQFKTFAPCKIIFLTGIRILQISTLTQHHPPMRTENNMDMQPRCIRSTFNAGNIIDTTRTEFKLRIINYILCLKHTSDAKQEKKNKFSHGIVVYD